MKELSEYFYDTTNLDERRAAHNTMALCQNLVEKQPTAYCVDKVEEKLKKEFKKYYGNQWEVVPYLANSIEIVKYGGVENE